MCVSLRVGERPLISFVVCFSRLFALPSSSQDLQSSLLPICAELPSHLQPTQTSSLCSSRRIHPSIRASSFLSSISLSVSDHRTAPLQDHHRSPSPPSPSSSPPLSHTAGLQLPAMSNGSNPNSPSFARQGTVMKPTDRKRNGSERPLRTAPAHGPSQLIIRLDHHVQMRISKKITRAIKLDISVMS